MRILALVILTLALGAGPASAAAWPGHIYRDLGLAIRCPSRFDQTIRFPPHDWCCKDRWVPGVAS